jgi:hypothetical protein
MTEFIVVSFETINVYEEKIQAVALPEGSAYFMF